LSKMNDKWNWDMTFMIGIQISGKRYFKSIEAQKKLPRRERKRKMSEPENPDYVLKCSGCREPYGD
jgi:hypothetical protein